MNPAPEGFLEHDSALTVDALLDQGLAALRVHDYARAAAEFTAAARVLELYPEMPDHAERQRIILESLGLALTITRGYSAAEVGRVYQLAVQISDPEQAFVSLRGIWMHFLGCGDLTRARAILAQLEALAGTDPVHGAHAAAAASLTELFSGQWQAAQEQGERALRLCPPRVRHFADLPILEHPEIFALCVLGAVHLHLGRPDTALALTRQALATSTALHHPFHEIFARCHALSLYNWLGLHAEAVEVAAPLCALTDRYPIAHWEALARLDEGWARCQLGDTAKGLVLVRKGLEQYSEGGGVLLLTLFISRLMGVLLAQGDPLEACSLSDQNLALLRSGVARAFGPETLRLRASLLRALARDGEARLLLEEAIAWSKDEGECWMRLRALTDLVAFEAERHPDSPPHRAQLADLLVQYTEGAALPDLVRARTLLATLAARP